jgi:hypothetical protein
LLSPLLGAHTLARTRPSLLILADALQVDGTLEPFGYADLHRQPHLRVAQGSFEVQPLLHVVVLQEVTLICSILRRWSAGCKRSIRHHIAIQYCSVLQFKSNRISHSSLLKRKIHRQTSLLHSSPPLNNEAYTSSTTNHPDPPPQCASRCMTTHLSILPTPHPLAVDSPPPVRIMRCCSLESRDARGLAT